LQVDGETMMEIVRRAQVPPSDLEVSIDFRRGGNSREYIREGWYEAEPNHTWTRGTYSNVMVPLQEPACRYALRIDAWPFAVPGKLEEQPLVLSVEGCLLAKFVITPGNRIIECELPRKNIGGVCLVIRLDHPNAARPSDLGRGADNRELAVAFRTLDVRRIVETTNN
jgi:hypothetical protein